MGVDGPRDEAAVVPPDIAEELLLGEDAIRIARELNREIELAAGERHRNPANSHLPGPAVDEELACLEQLGGAGSGTAQDSVDPGHELLIQITLHDVVRSALEGAHAVDGVGAR